MLPKAHSHIMEITPYIGGKSKVAGVERVVKLSSNENPKGASPLALEAFKSAATDLNRYPDSSYTSLRSAIGEAYGLNPDNIVCGAGSDELIGLLVHTFAGEGDEVLYSQHGFLMYKIYALSYGAVPVTAPEKNLRADVDAILSKVTDRTKLVFVANPNNPTGSYITADELKYLHSKLPEHVILAVDAAYAEYVEEKDYSDGLGLAKSTNNTVMLRTFSKVFGLSALRLGWGYFPSAIADALNRTRGPFNVSSLAAKVGEAAVKDKTYLQECVKENNSERARMAEALTQLGLKVYPSVANFLLVEFKNAIKANEFLQSKGLIVRDVAAYGLTNCLRITIGLREDNDAVIKALTEFSNLV